MRISARCDYACRALLELTLHWPRKEPLQIHTISEKQDIPMRYLVQILIQLKRLGLVSSIRGKEGGYNLTKPPNKIRLGEVIRQIQGPFLSAGNPRREQKYKGYIFETIWSEVEGAVTKVLDKVTFEDISNKAKGLDKTLMYQI